MAKDPAFLFYSSDFLTGVLTMSFEDRGKYITILSLMHQQGRMDEESIRLLVGSFSDRLKSKFLIDENGNFYNQRLEEEVLKRNKFTESRRNNGLKGGRPKDNIKPKRKLKVKHKDNLMENENINENIDKDKDKKVEVLKFPFETESFKNHWDVWKRYKKEQHNFTYKSIISEQGALKSISELSNQSEELAIRIINQSIDMGWKGLFSIKNNEQNGTTKNDRMEQFTNYFKRKGRQG